MDSTKETMVLGGPGRSWEVLGGPRNAREAGIPGTVHQGGNRRRLPPTEGVVGGTCILRCYWPFRKVSD